MSSLLQSLLFIALLIIATVTVLLHAPSSNATVSSHPIKGTIKGANVKELTIEHETRNAKGVDQEYRRTDRKRDGKKNEETYKYAMNKVRGRKSLGFGSSAENRATTSTSSFKTSKHYHSNDATDLVAFTSDYRSPRHHPPKNN
ncbi:hypothetical protein LINPERPRIM_LOCUS28831 [Linum perenne]